MVSRRICRCNRVVTLLIGVSNGVTSVGTRESHCAYHGHDSARSSRCGHLLRARVLGSNPDRSYLQPLDLTCCWGGFHSYCICFLSEVHSAPDIIVVLASIFFSFRRFCPRNFSFLLYFFAFCFPLSFFVAFFPDSSFASTPYVYFIFFPFSFPLTFFSHLSLFSLISLYNHFPFSF